MKNENEKTLLLFDKLTNSLNQTDYQVAFNKLENLRGNTYNGREFDEYIVILVNYRVIWDIIGEDNIIAYGDKWILADLGEYKRKNKLSDLVLTLDLMGLWPLTISKEIRSDGHFYMHQFGRAHRLKSYALKVLKGVINQDD